MTRACYTAENAPWPAEECCPQGFYINRRAHGSMETSAFVPLENPGTCLTSPYVKWYLFAAESGIVPRKKVPFLIPCILTGPCVCLRRKETFPPLPSLPFHPWTSALIFNEP